MRILVVHPGASWSTHDVYVGIRDALRRQGHDVTIYALDGRIAVTHEYLQFVWRRGDRVVTQPNKADAVYLAGSGILERAFRCNADWVLVISAMYLAPDWLVLLKRAGLRVGIVFTESPYEDDKQARVAPWADICWVNERTSVEHMRQANPNTYYLAHAYDSIRHSPARPGVAPATLDVASHDVVFVGTAFRERVELLSAAEWDGIDLGLYGNWASLGSRSQLRRRTRGKTIDNDQTVKLYQQAKIGLNMHRLSMGWERNAPRIAHAESLNPRAYELAACGLFHISDYRAELGDVFGDVVPTFHSATELEKLVRYYLAHEEERMEISAKLPALVAGHTFDARVGQMIGQMSSSTEPKVAQLVSV